MELTGTLKNAVMYNIEGFNVVTGFVYGDVHGRFEDGSPIRTSYVKSGPDENGIIKTRNSTYKIESWAE